MFLTYVLFGILILFLLHVISKQSGIDKTKNSGLTINFDSEAFKHIQNLKQRCEHKSEIEVLKHALATYDVLTQAVTDRKTIMTQDEDGYQEKLDLFPVKE